MNDGNTTKLDWWQCTLFYGNTFLLFLEVTTLPPSFHHSGYSSCHFCIVLLHVHKHKNEYVYIFRNKTKHNKTFSWPAEWIHKALVDTCQRHCDLPSLCEIPCITLPLLHVHLLNLWYSLQKMIWQGWLFSLQVYTHLSLILVSLQNLKIKPMTVSVKSKVGFSTFCISIYIFCAKIQFGAGLFFCHSLFADTLNMNLNFRVLAWLSWVQVARQRLQIPEGTRVTRLCCFLAGNLTRCGLTSIHSKNAGSYVRCYFTQRWRVKTYTVKIHKEAHNATEVAYFLCKYSN